MTREKVPTEQSLVETLQRLQPHVRSGPECEGVVPKWEQGPMEDGTMDVRCLVGPTSWRTFQELEDKCEAIAENRELVGVREAKDAARDAMWELAGPLSRRPKEVAASTFATLTTAPGDRLALVPIYGMNLVSPVDCCGIALRTFDVAAIVQEFAASDAERTMMEQELKDDQGKVNLYAIARVPGDHERACRTVARRARVALVLSVLGNPIHDQQWGDDWSAQFVPTSTFSLRTFMTDGRVTEGYQLSRTGLPLQYRGDRVRDAVASRAGLQVLSTLAAWRLRDASDLQRRVLRAAVLLADSLDGTTADRFLRRWMALEAIVGREPGEVTERVAERLGVLTTDDGEERLRRKKFFRDQYGLRSELAHGRRVPVLNRTADLFKLLAFAALERAAMLSNIGEESFFDELDRAKFRGASLTDGPWLDTGSWIRVA